MKASHHRHHTETQRPRITVALLSDRLYYGYPIEVYQGVKRAAQEHDINLVCVAGGIPNEPTKEHLPGTVLYGLVGPRNVDGVIVISSLLSTFLDDAGLLAFHKQYHRLPLVSLGLAILGSPSLLVDNYIGMHHAVSHLIERHNCRTIACIRGPKRHQEAEERYQAYVDALTQHGLPLRPELVTVGTFMPNSGEAAIATLLDMRRVQFDAIVSGNDWMLKAAITALRKRNIQVPTQISAVGFDDLEESRSFNPPLTTVRQPFYQMGLQAIQLLLDQIAGREVPETTLVPTELVIRQSCGCHSIELTQARIQPAYGYETTDSSPENFSAYQSAICSEIQNSAEWKTGNFKPDWLHALLTAFSSELEAPSTATFFPALNHILQQASEAQNDLNEWQTLISLVRRQTLARLTTPELSLRAEHLWQQARVAVAETVRLAHEAREVRIKHQQQLLRKIGARLITTFELKDLLAILSQELPRLNIPSATLALYEHPMPYEEGDSAPEFVTLFPIEAERRHIELPAGGQRSPSPDLLPKERLSQNRAMTLVVVPLFFQNEQIGFIYFEDEVQDLTIYNALRVELSSALQGALLIKRIQTHAHELTVANEEIRTLNDQLKEENLRMGAELAVSQRIQQMMLPPRDELQHLVGLEIVGFMKPADEVGGDYYDVLTHNGHIHIGIGDVTGHGLESGLLMLMTQTAIRTLIEYGDMDAVTFLNTVNRTLYKNIQRMRVDKMLTLVLLSYQDGLLRIIGQHEEVLVVRHGGKVERICTSNLGFPLGLQSDIRHLIAEATVSLEPGETVVLYTDGITEAENRDHHLYGIERLSNVLSRHWRQSAESMKEAILEDVSRHIGSHKIYDDLTLVIFKPQEILQSREGELSLRSGVSSTPPDRC